MTENLRLITEPGNIYVDYVSYNDFTTANLTVSQTINNSMNEGSTGSGYYYNYYTSTGNNGSMAIDDDIDGSICAKGFKLPYNGTSSTNRSYTKLAYVYDVSSSATGVTKLKSYPLSFVGTGFYWDNKPYASSSNPSHLWSSGSKTDNGYNFAWTNSGIVYLQNLNNSKDFGFSIRCVAL